MYDLKVRQIRRIDVQIKFKVNAINNAKRQEFTSKYRNVKPDKKVNLTVKRFRSISNIKVHKNAVCNMFVKLLLISTICTFAYARSIESGEVQPLSLFGDPVVIADLNMDTESTKIEERALHLPTTPKSVDETLPRPTEDIPATNHESTHSESKHPKKRATNYKEDHQTDLRPGCCG